VSLLAGAEGVRVAISDLYLDYAAAIDEGRIEDWPEFFVEDCLYKVVARENHDRGLPLGLQYFESKGMLRDRAYSIRSLLTYSPRPLLHIIGTPRVRRRDDEAFDSTANYVVYETRDDEEPRVLSIGRYLDVIVETPSGPRFRERLCVYDNELIYNSIPFPI
jgi:salicylate 5-hydroxylase small subunit